MLRPLNSDREQTARTMSVVIPIVTRYSAKVEAAALRERRKPRLIGVVLQTITSDKGGKAARAIHSRKRFPGDVDRDLLHVGAVGGIVGSVGDVDRRVKAQAHPFLRIQRAVDDYRFFGIERFNEFYWNGYAVGQLAPAHHSQLIHDLHHDLRGPVIFPSKAHSVEARCQSGINGESQNANDEHAYHRLDQREGAETMASELLDAHKCAVGAKALEANWSRLTKSNLLAAIWTVLSRFKSLQIKEQERSEDPDLSRF